MFVYFNKEGVIKEIINDSSIRQGNANVNTVYFFIEGADPQTARDDDGLYYKALFFSLGRYTMYLLDEHGEPLPSIEGESFDLTTVKMEVPYDKKKELKYFKYFTRYEMFQLPIPQEVLNYKGTVGLKFQMINNDAINTQGLVVFNIEGTSPDLEIAPDTAITIAEWNYLLANMLTPGDVYTKSEVNSTFQEKLIAGDNITITEDNVISATGGGGPGGRAEWGYISGNIENQTDLQTELDGKQDTLTFDNTPTSDSSNPVTSDGIFDALQDVREVAEGKCDTFVLSYADTIASIKADIQQHSSVKVFNGSGTDITDDVTSGAYDNQTFGNANFNSQANEIYCFQSPYYTYLIVRVKDGYMFLSYIDVFYRKKGDIYLVIETDVPDRWYGNDYTFYKLETSKIDLTNYVTVSGSPQTISGEKTFSSPTVFNAATYQSTSYISNIYVGTGNHIYSNDTNKIILNNGSDYTYWDGSTIKTTCNIIPYGSGYTCDLGASGGTEWHDVYASHCYYLGANKKWQLQSYGNYIDFYRDDSLHAWRMGVSALIPQQNDAEIGEASNPVLNLYLSGAIKNSDKINFRPNSVSYDLFSVSSSEVLTWVGIRPAANGSLNLGTSTSKWKDLYLSGTINSSAASNSNVLTTTAGYIAIDSNSKLVLGEPNNEIRFYGDNIRFASPLLRPQTSGGTSLGNNDYKFSGLYLSGNLSDGTNQTTIANVNNNFAPTYDATQTYSVGDLVIYQGRLYKCTTAITTPEAWTAAHWTATDVASNAGSGGSSITIERYI